MKYENANNECYLAAKKACGLVIMITEKNVFKQANII